LQIDRDGLTFGRTPQTIHGPVCGLGTVTERNPKCLLQKGAVNLSSLTGRQHWLAERPTGSSRYSGRTHCLTVTAEEIEAYLRDRLRQRVRISTSSGFVEHGLVKPATVHQEYRELNPGARVRRGFCSACSSRRSQETSRKIESEAPRYLRNVILIISETGLRVYKELALMKKSQVDLDNAVVWIPDSKTASRVADVPLTDLAVGAFRDQLKIAGPGEWLFPSEDNRRGYQGSFKNAWRGTLARAGVPYLDL
jgi:integrase